jgi:hypothetical protein
VLWSALPRSLWGAGQSIGRILNASASRGTPRVYNRQDGLGARRFCSAVPPLLGLTMTNEHEDLVVKVFGCSYEEFVAHTAAVLRFQQRRMHRAKALLGI